MVLGYRTIGIRVTLPGSNSPCSQPDSTLVLPLPTMLLGIGWQAQTCTGQLYVSLRAISFTGHTDLAAPRKELVFSEVSVTHKALFKAPSPQFGGLWPEISTTVQRIEDWVSGMKKTRRCWRSSAINLMQRLSACKKNIIP